MYDANMNNEKVQEVAHMIIPYGYYQGETKKWIKSCRFLFYF